MMKKELMNKKVVRAIALGLSAVMLTTPITAHAETAGDNTSTGNGDDNNNIENQEQQSEVKEAASAANNAIDDAADETNTVKADIEENVESGEAGTAVVEGNDGEEPQEVDLAQAVIDASAVVEDAESEEGASIADADTAVANADTQIDVAEANAELAEGAVTQVESEVDDVEAIVTEAKDIADKAVEDVKTETENIKNAATIEDANAAYEAAEAVVEQAKTDFEAKKAEYDSAKSEYDAAVAKVAEYEAAYNDAVAKADANAADAAAELAAAKAAAEELESAVAAAKDAVDASAADAMRIAKAETLTQEDGGLNWRNEDTLFIAIMEEYYLPEKEGIEGAIVTRVQGADNNSMNYFKAVYTVNGEEKVAYYNYKMDGDSKNNIVIFEKREVEIFGGEYDQYVDADDEVKDIEAGLADGSLVAITDGDGNDTYYEKNDVTAEDTLVENSEITSTSTEDVTVSEQTTETYKIAEDGSVVKEVSADVTTVTYTGKEFISDEVYATDAERDAAAQDKLDELNAAEGKDVEIVETQNTTTTYVATGTYIPTFTATVTVKNEEVEKGWGLHDEANSKKEAVDFVYDEKLGDKYDDEEKYYIISRSNNMSVTGMTKEETILWGTVVTDDSDYLVSGTASVTYAKVTKKSVNKNTFGAIWDDITSWFGGDSANEKIEAAVKGAIEAAGGIFVKANWSDWDWDKATVYYVEGVAVESEEKDTVADAKKDLNDVAEAQAKANGASGVYNVKSETEEIDTTTYSYAINYYEKVNEKTENKVVATETYANAETLEGQIIQNLNYINGKILLDQNNEDYREFVDSAKNLTEKYQRLLDEANVADKAVAEAQAKVAELQAAIDAMEGEVNNADKLAELAGQLAEAEKALAGAQEDYDSLQNLMEEAAEALEVVVDALTPDAVDDEEDVVDALTPDAVGDDEEDDDDTTPAPVIPVVTPVVLDEAPVAPVAVETPVVAAPAVVDIDDEATPLAGGIGDGNGDAEGGEDEVIVAGAEEEVEPAIVAIEDEETPLAAGVEADAKMSWWWLLLIALLGATGYKMYKDQQKKKEEAQEA